MKSINGTKKILTVTGQKVPQSAVREYTPEYRYM